MPSRLFVQAMSDSMLDQERNDLELRLTEIREEQARRVKAEAVAILGSEEAARQFEGIMGEIKKPNPKVFTVEKVS